MINSMGMSGLSGSMPLPPKNDQPLSDEQQQLLSETLSEFDPDNLNEADAQTIVAALSDAGIQPGKSLGDAMNELGFDAKQIGDLSGQERRPPPPPKQSTEEITDISSFLTEAIAEKLSATGGTELTGEDKQDVLSKLLEKYGINEGESIINTTA